MQKNATINGNKKTEAASLCFRKTVQAMYFQK